ncbi:MAG TPA: glycosyltransferase [Cellulomonas sp.]
MSEPRTPTARTRVARTRSALAATALDLPGGTARAMRARAATLVRTLSGAEPPTAGRDLVAALEQLLRTADRSVVWLTLAVLRAQLPVEQEVVGVARRLTLDGPATVLAPLLRTAGRPVARGRAIREVEVVRDAVLVDLEHTAHTTLATGIQRVARQTARRWARDQEIVLVGWTSDRTALRRLTAAEQSTAIDGEPPQDGAPDDHRVIVPWHASFLLVELATETPRTSRTLALARHAHCRTGAIGFDCVPITSGETIGDGMGAAFSTSLAAVREMDAVGAISDAAATEYEGWRTMLAGTGLPGPRVVPVVLPVEALAPTGAALARMTERLAPGARPVVLCVGSHEPRKNHLAVLHAAELAWREGTDFSLVFVGGNSWSSMTFRHRMAELQEQGRPVQSLSALSDDDLWAAYRLARCTVFPSFNEGFGLPVAESLATGTPVITSDFGSMAEIARHGGAVLVDPRDDRALSRAITALVTDDALHDRLAAEALAAPARTWDDYAAELWQALVG